MVFLSDLIFKLRQHFLPLGYFISSGVLIGLCFIWPTFWVAVFPGIILFIMGLRQTHSLVRVLFYGFLAWTIKASFVMFWVWSTYPILWVDMGLGKAELPVIGFYWLTISIFLGLGGAVAALGLWVSNRLLKPIWLLLFAPLVWLAAEVLGAYSISLFTLGEYIEINKVFSFGHVGYLLAEHEWLIQLARWGGVYFLTLIIVFIATLLWFYIGKAKFSSIAMQVTLLVLVIIFVSGQIEFREKIIADTESKTTVAIIDTEFGGEKYFNLPNREQYRVDKIIEALASAIKQEPDYVVMSEDSRYQDPNLSPGQSYARFRFQQGDPEAVVIEAGPVNLKEGGKVVRSYIYDGLEKKVYGADKQILVPQGEYMPSLYTHLLSLFGFSKEAKFVDSILSYRPGPMVSQAEFPKHLPRVLFCFNSADPFGVRKLVEQREVPFIAHPISYAWFHDPVSMRHQYDAMLKIHAVWNQVTIVSAGNMVSGLMYTPQGEIIKPTIVAEGEDWQVSLVSW